MKILVNVTGDKFIGIAVTIVICCHIDNYKIADFSNTLMRKIFSIQDHGHRGGKVGHRLRTPE